MESMKIEYVLKPNCLWLIALVLVSFFQESQAQRKGTFEITGSLAKRDTGFIVLAYTDYSGKDVDDTVRVNHGNFHFKGNINGPTRAALRGELKSRSTDDPNFTIFFLEPKSMQLVVEHNKFKSADLTGSKSQMDYIRLLELKRPHNESIDSLEKLYTAIKSEAGKGVQSNVIKDSLARTWAKLPYFSSKNQKVDLDFISSNPNSFVSLDLFWYYTDGRKISIDSAQNLLDKLSPTLKQNDLWFEFSKRLKTQREVELMQQHAQQVGKPAFDFSRKSNLGKQVTLSSYKDKQYVLLDFWATWCLPCIEYIPHLKEISKKYSGTGLEIISISLDSDMESWKKGIKKYGLAAFTNIHDYNNEQDLKSKNLPSAISIRYGVKVIPAYVLIDKNGVVLGIYNTNENHEIPALDAKLKDLFK
ncbi:TlpA disulfide reductase family protein [Pedobacter gandavensis]|uniref:Redoxin domain-containing protein n=1 Tax=Pedobacter gandavensis TaxID=2679963 RepID=A0ABR6EPV7_9SPHI|nr:TlpA disulfide reductase family protein [Pedobacter gandavensis]MBB2147285.1 redoxin domain-containing protein [Pedobacter gandavensis]